MNKTRQWPNDYLTWTGTIEDLVREAGEVLRQISPEVEAPTLSGVRYYQTKGALGRGQKRGRTSTFSFDDLATVVATKQMVKQQLPLSVTRGMLASTSSDTLMKSAGMEGYVDYGSPAAAASMAMTQTPGETGNQAEQAVAKLLAASNLPAHRSLNASYGALKGGNLPLMANAMLSSTPTFAPTAVVPALPPGGMLRYALAAGVSVEIPADGQDRAAQANALRAFADQLDPPPHLTWSTP